MGKIWIPEDKVAQHTQVIGTTGTGKTSVALNFVHQAVEKDWPMVITDLKREYLKELYRPGIDYLIDFSDERCVRWMIGEEAVDEIEATAIAEGAFPDEPRRNPFFQGYARDMFAYLLGAPHVHRERVTTSNLARWLTNKVRLRQMFKSAMGDAFAELLDPDSGEMKQGMVATLNQFSRPLRWMPEDPERQQFSVKAWSEDPISRRIFLSSSKMTKTALRPLQSLILDMCILQVKRPTLFLLDEIGEFGRSPQLELAITMQRSVGAPIVMLYQGISQLIGTYTKEMAESITTNPYTTVILRTMGEISSKQCSAILGMPAEIRRERESRSRWNWFYHRPHTTLNSEQLLIPAILPGEIQSLEDGHGYVGQAGNITRLRVPFLRAQENQPAWIRRVMDKATVQKMMADAAAADFEERALAAQPDMDVDAMMRESYAQFAETSPRPYKSRYTV